MAEAQISLDSALSHAYESGVVRLLDISVGSDDFFTRSDTVEELKKRFPIDIYMTAGIPPYFSDKRVDGDIDSVVRQAKRGVAAIGEIGLDYYHDYGTHNAQIELFVRQIEVANRLDLPVIIHTRDSDADLIHTLKTNRVKQTGIIHCFSSAPETARKLLDLGFYLSFAGNCTYRTSVHIQDALDIVPADRFVIETDAPYLSPEGYRGKPNEPGHLAATARFIAERRKTTLAELARRTWENGCRVLGLS
jgi:TatD DNase family protein